MYIQLTRREQSKQQDDSNRDGVALSEKRVKRGLFPCMHHWKDLEDAKSVNCLKQKIACRMERRSLG